MANSTSSVEQIIYEIMVNASGADATIESMGTKMIELSRTAGVSLRSIGDAWKKVTNQLAESDKIDSEFMRLINRAVQYADSLDKVRLAKEKALSVQEIRGQGVVDAGIAERNAEEIRAQGIEDARIAARNAELVKAQSIEDARIAQANAEKKRLQKEYDAEMLKAQGIMDADIAKKNEERKAQEALNLSLQNGTATNKQYAESLRATLSAQTQATLRGISPTSPVNPQMISQIKSGMQEIQTITGLSVDRVQAILRTMFSNIPTQGINKAAKQLATDLNQVETASKKTAGGLFGLNNIFRTMLGTMTAMSIFLITQFVQNALKKSIESIKQLELAIFNLSNAEKALSRAGVDITPTDFEKMAQAVRDTGIAISEIDLTKLISNTASGTADLGLTVQQMQDLAVAASVIAFRSGKTVEDVQQQLQTGITTSGRGLKDLKIQVDAAVIQQKAIDSGLVASEAAWNNLTAAQRQQIEVASIILLINENVATSLEDIQTMNGSITQSTQKLSVAWENFLTSMGELARPAIIDGLTMLVNQLERMNEWLTENEQPLRKLVAAFTSLMAIQEQLNTTEKNGFEKVFFWVSPALSQMRDFLKLAKDVPGLSKTMVDAYNEALKSFDDFDKKAQDTPTSPTSPKAPGGNDDLAKALEKMNKEILDAQLKLQQDMEDAAIDMGRKLVDIDIEYARKRADAQTDYTNKIADINRSYNEKIQDIQTKQREDDTKAKQDQLDKERQFQNDMLELKENYLMSLDDALHNRDARQILKLQAQYELDKLQAERKHGLDQQSVADEAKARANSYKEERRMAEADRKAKLAEAQRDLADKLAQLEIERKREIADANLDYERKKQDLEKAMHDRLNIVAANLVQEFNLTKTGLDAIAKLYGKYYSYVAGLYAAMQKMLSGTGGNISPPVIGTQNDPRRGRGFGAAEGGTFIANRPTTITFGEAGLEKATFTPLGRMGRDVSKTFTNVSGLGAGSGGKVSIELVLSPDLESRIIGNSMDATAEVIMRTMRGQR